MSTTSVWGLPHNVRAVLSEFPALRIESGTRHPKVRHPNTLDWVPVPVSPSGSRWLKNLRSQLRRLDSTGHGFIFAKGGKQ